MDLPGTSDHLFAVGTSFGQMVAVGTSGLVGEPFDFDVDSNFDFDSDTGASPAVVLPVLGG